MDLNGVYAWVGMAKDVVMDGPDLAVVAVDVCPVDINFDVLKKALSKNPFSAHWKIYVHRTLVAIVN